MINVNTFSPGTTFKKDGKVYSVVSSQHSKTGRGQAHVKTKVKNLETKNITQITFTGGEMVEPAFIETTKTSYLYNDGDQYIFMDSKSYEQLILLRENLNGKENLLIENLEVQVVLFENKPIDCIFPANVEYEVATTEPAVRGNTSKAALKKCTLANGLKVMIPLFVKAGDRILVNSDSLKYSGKV